MSDEIKKPDDAKPVAVKKRVKKTQVVKEADAKLPEKQTTDNSDNAELKAQVAALTKQVEELTRNHQTLENHIFEEQERERQRRLHAAIHDAEEEARLAEKVIATAIAEANGDAAARAIKFRDEALDKIRAITPLLDDAFVDDVPQVPKKANGGLMSSLAEFRRERSLKRPRSMGCDDCDEDYCFD